MKHLKNSNGLSCLPNLSFVFPYPSFFVPLFVYVGVDLSPTCFSIAVFPHRSSFPLLLTSLSPAFFYCNQRRYPLLSLLLPLPWYFSMSPLFAVAGTGFTAVVIVISWGGPLCWRKRGTVEPLKILGGKKECCGGVSRWCSRWLRLTRCIKTNTDSWGVEC